jgi:hypothetical protein
MKTIGTKAQVMHGNALKTSGGLTKSDIKTVTKNGVKRYISKAKSTQGKKNGWIKAVNQAKKNLGIPKNEFVLLKKSSSLYKEAARLYYD